MHILASVSRCGLATNENGEVMQFKTGRNAGQDIINLSIEGLNLVLGDRFKSLADLPREGEYISAHVEPRFPKGKRPFFILKDWNSYSPFR